MIKRITQYCFYLLVAFTVLFASDATVSANDLAGIEAIVSEEYDAFLPDSSFPTANESQVLFDSISSRRTVRRFDAFSNDLSYNVSGFEIFLESLLESVITTKKQQRISAFDSSVPLNGYYLALHRHYVF